MDYFIPSSTNTLFSSEGCTSVEPLRFLLRFLVLLRMRCEVFAWNRFTLPEPVTLKRFFALECVLIFGMSKLNQLMKKASANIMLFALAITM